jgi:transposase
MYIRQISRKNKDGSKVTYVQLAHNEWDPKKRLCSAKVLYNFGRIENIDIEQLKRLVKSISRFLPASDAAEAEALIQNRGRRFTWIRSRSYGGIHVLSELWEKLDFDKLIKGRIKNRNFSTPIALSIFAMVANRALAPSSKLATSEWVEKDVYIPDLPEVGVQVLYRGMDFLLEHQDELEKEIYWSVADLMNLEVDLLFFDTTTTYFETHTETDLKKQGYSKDKRPDLPQVVVGLAVTRSGIPVKHWVFPGNTADMSTIERVKNDLGNWHLNRCIIVHDRGMASEDNLQYLQRGGGHYIVGRKMRTGEPEIEETLGTKGRYTTIEEDLLAKQVIVGDGEKRKRLVIVKNLKNQKHDKEKREKLIEVLQERIDHLNSRRTKNHNKQVCELKSHRTYGKYVKELGDGTLKINRMKLREESRYDGKYIVETSDDTLNLKDIVLGYKQLFDIERAFRTLKSDLDLHPNYHSTTDRIKCHIFLCFIALVLVRIIENKTKRTWSKIRKELMRIHYGEFIVDSKKIFQLTELTDNQVNIFKSLNIKKPRLFLGIQDIENS